jgi:fatty-acyl-CoA synthase
MGLTRSLLLNEGHWPRNATVPPAPERTSVADLLDTAVERWASRAAFVCGDEEVTYQDVADLATSAERRLRDAGVGHGDRVALWMANSADFLGWYFGCARIGAVLVPLHTRSTADEIEVFLQVAPPSILVVGEGIGGPRPAEVERVLAHRALRELGVSTTDSVLRPPPADAVHAISSGWVPAPDDRFLIKFTSGSSGTPKGVQLAHAQIVRNAYNVGSRLGLEPGDMFFSPMPFYHSGGSILTILTAFGHGATIVSLRRFDPDDALAAIQEHRCTSHIGMDVMYLKEMNAQSFKREALTSLRTGWIAGLSDAAWRVWDGMQFPFVSLYGMTEVSGNICMAGLDDPPDLRVKWAGVPQPGLEVGVFDPQSDALMPVGCAGEIRVRGWGVMEGYLGERSDGGAIDDDAWLRTGDTGLVGENGYLQFLGRMREALKVGGENVSCAEVEAALTGHSSVAIAQVVGVYDEVYGELPVAFVQVAANRGATSEELSEWCRGKMAGYKVPRHVFLLSESDWPLTGPEKISRPGLRALAEELVGKTAARG